MEIEYADVDVQKLCDDTKRAVRKLGAEQAKRLRLRLGHLLAAPDLATLYPLCLGRCHQLQGGLRRRSPWIWMGRTDLCSTYRAWSTTCLTAG